MADIIPIHINMTTRKVAIVTGSNKGIGLAVVRGLCKEFNGDVILTARDCSRGQTAAGVLRKEGLAPKFHQLDITDHASIEKLHDFIKENYGGLDILVNNAAIYYSDESTVPFAEQAETCAQTNFWGTLDVCDTLFPLLRPHARVVNVSSLTSTWTLQKLRQERKSAALGVKNVGDIKKMMTEFVKDAKAGDHHAKGWPNSAYGMSKVGVTALSILQQMQMDSQGKDDIFVNAICPGYVATDMSDHKGPLTVEQGAETPLYAALLAQNIKEPRGALLSEKKATVWA